MKVRLAVTILVAVMLIPVLSMAGEVVFIGNSSVPASTLSEYDVKNIFLGIKPLWDDGAEIILVVQTDSSAHDEFLKKYIGKTSAQFTNYWKKQLFSGKGLVPPSKASDQEIINFVRQNKGAIGYVSTDTGLDNVKVISVR